MKNMYKICSSFDNFFFGEREFIIFPYCVNCEIFSATVLLRKFREINITPKISVKTMHSLTILTFRYFNDVKKY